MSGMSWAGCWFRVVLSSSSVRRMATRGLGVVLYCQRPDGLCSLNLYIMDDVDDSTLDAIICFGLVSLFLNLDLSDLEFSSLYEYSFSLFVFLREFVLGENRLPLPRDGAAVDVGSLNTE
uniref:Uncharacterized protein n=1 Tax=Cacopsylla melanoneura TaxID=428564 RepID=A0A8D9EI05_9HEMI